MTDNLLQRKQWQSSTMWENAAAQRTSSTPKRQVNATAKGSQNVPEKVLITRRWSPCHIPQKELVCIPIKREAHVGLLTPFI